jgi:predicted transcriptional regulator
LGELESRVMEILWDSPGQALKGRFVADQLPDYAYTTVATVLERLSRKGHVERTSAGRVNLYRATGTPGSLAAQVMSEALEKTLDQDQAMDQFVGSMSAEQRRLLHDVLNRRTRR